MAAIKADFTFFFTFILILYQFCNLFSLCIKYFSFLKIGVF